MRRLAGLACGLALLACAGCASTVASAIKVMDNDPDVVTINREAQLAYESGEDAKAEALYKALVRQIPNDSETWFRLGNLYARNNRADEAANAYQRALVSNNADARAWHNLGVVRLRQAWAAMLQSFQFLRQDDPMFAHVESVVKHLGRMPLVNPDGKPVAEAAPKPAVAREAAK